MSFKKPQCCPTNARQAFLLKQSSWIPKNFNQILAQTYQYNGNHCATQNLSTSQGVQYQNNKMNKGFVTTPMHISWTNSNAATQNYHYPRNIHSGDMSQLRSVKKQVEHIHRVDMNVSAPLVSDTSYNRKRNYSTNMEKCNFRSAQNWHTPLFNHVDQESGLFIKRSRAETHVSIQSCHGFPSHIRMIQTLPINATSSLHLKSCMKNNGEKRRVRKVKFDDMDIS